MQVSPEGGIIYRASPQKIYSQDVSGIVIDWLLTAEEQMNFASSVISWSWSFFQFLHLS